MEAEKNDEPVKTGEWVWTILVACIPIVGLIALLIWAFSESTNVNKKNWARGYLICAIIGIVVWMMFGAALMGGLYSATGAF